MEVLKKLWRFLRSMKFGIILLLLIAALSVVLGIPDEMIAAGLVHHVVHDQRRLVLQRGNNITDISLRFGNERFFELIGIMSCSWCCSG